jgi:hypothetical protein
MSSIELRFYVEYGTPSETQVGVSHVRTIGTPEQVQAEVDYLTRHHAAIVGDTVTASKGYGIAAQHSPIEVEFDEAEQYGWQHDGPEDW